MDYPKIWSKHLRSGAQQEAQHNGLKQQKQQQMQVDAGLHEPIECLSKKQMDKIAKKAGKVKQPKLLSSKSLSQFVPRALFFRKSANTGQQQASNHDDANVHKANNLVTTKSFPISSYKQQQQQQRSRLESSSSIISSSSVSRQEQFITRINSASMLGLPRQSSSSTFAVRSNNSSTMEQPNLSPIVIVTQQQQHHVGRYLNKENGNEVTDMSWTENGPSGEHSGGQIDAEVQEKSCGQNYDEADEEDNDNKNDKSPKRMTNNNKAKYRPFKNTTLVLRDVKNSIGLRMKAKRGSQAFAKLTEEQATPPTKLYSPFNIYTPDSCTKKNDTDIQRRDIGLRKLDAADFKTPDNKDNRRQQDTATVKGRIAFQHKKHLMQANKFTFDSPTGRLRETVKDVERFQQCIEDISKAIKARDSV